MLNSIEQAKRAHTGNWFAPETMKWWGTRLCTAQVWPVSDGILFITSDKPGFAAERTYQVRFCHDSGRIDTLYGPEDDGPWRMRTAREASKAASAARAAWVQADPDNDFCGAAAMAAHATATRKAGNPS